MARQLLGLLQTLEARLPASDLDSEMTPEDAEGPTAVEEHTYAGE